MESYVSALLSPFSSKAKGAQIPDPYSFQTETQYVRSEFTINSQPNGLNLGSWDCVVMPNIFQSVLNSVPISGVNLASKVGGVYSDPQFQLACALATTSSGPAAFVNYAGCVTSTLAAQQLESYRIVGYGVRIRPLSALNDLCGKIIVAATPVARNCIFTPEVSKLANNVYQALDLPGVDQTGFITSEILNCPDSMSASVQYIASKGGIEFRGKMTSPCALSFRPTSFVANSLVRTWGLTASSAVDSSPEYYLQIQDAVASSLTFDLSGAPAARMFSNIPIAGMQLFATTAAFAKSGTALATISSVTKIAGTPDVMRITWGAATAIPVGIYILSENIPVEATKPVVDPNFILNEGWSGLCIRGIGCNQNAFAIEVIYHVEGPPLIGNQGALTGATSREPFVDNELFVRVNEYNNSSNSFKYVNDASD